MKAKLIALILALFLLVPVIALADVNFILENTSDQARIVQLFWIDHPHEIPGRFQIAEAALEPGKSFKMSNPFPPGTYYAEWRLKTSVDSDKGLLVAVGKRSRVIRITPRDVILMEAGSIKRGISI